MRIIGCLSFRLPHFSEAKRDATGRRRSRVRPLLEAILTTLVFVLLVISATPPSVGRAAFPGINGKIAFQSNRDGNYEIYVMNADGSNQTRLTNNAATDFNPAWSADGTKIAFESDRDGNFEIYTMNADGSNQTRLTNDGANDDSPAWSPTGTKIAFARSAGPRAGDIYVMNSDGSGQTKLTNNVPGNFPFYFAPAWSPDGTEIALLVALSDSNQEIYVMNADGSDLTALTSNGVLSYSVNWSPDGAKIAFSGGPSGSAAVYVMNSDGSGQTSLTNNGDTAAAWSPDGTKIAFTSGRDGNGEIYVMNADGSGQLRLTSNSAEDGHPDWQSLSSSVISVEIDIKPGSEPNSVNPGSKEVIPVAILTTATFDATTVDPLSVHFGPNGATEAHHRGHPEDVDGDGDQDLVLHFNTQDTGIQCGNTSASLTGETFGGQAIEGSDSINTVGC